MSFLLLTQVASYGKCRKTEGWELNRAHDRSQWIDKSTAHVQEWLGYVSKPSELDD